MTAHTCVIFFISFKTLGCTKIILMTLLLQGQRLSMNAYYVILRVIMKFGRRRNA
jgi:hypothetical protein